VLFRTFSYVEFAEEKKDQGEQREWEKTFRRGGSMIRVESRRENDLRNARLGRTGDDLTVA
jgi:hypothetical protein